MTVRTDALLAADPAVPDRDRLLDPARADVPVAAAVVEIVRCKYRVGESLRVLYRCTTERASQLVSVRAAAGARPRWWVFPDDRRLVAARALLEPAAAVVALAGGRAWVCSDVAEYAPERSLTVRALDHDGRTVAFAKHVAPGGVDIATLAARYACVARGLRGSGRPVVVPAPLGWAARPDVLVLEAMAGTRWLDLPAGGGPHAVGLMGSGIASLHGVAPPPGTGQFERLGPRRLVAGAAAVAAARPDVSPSMTALVDRLEATRSSEPPVALHGDCHPKNALVDGDRLALIDLDQSGLGPAAADIGSLLARLHVATILGHQPPDVERALGDAFLAGYASVSPPPGARSLAWHTAAALLAEQAVRAVNRVRPDVLAHLPDLLGAALELVPARSPR